ncbi:ABC transporter ATP-binding protein [Acuticoccus mangrovi]|uniref:ATP-binding cassette domain-containing protein n=1 Tax=Acuticoccus mangrovi TaxID=2796142 RepID=A0A934MJS9_9HYPH|nr:ATP-binding cassette domain-containing protein [Acuticoccus mangrovi]MBJ3774854.1 ATP-binding cassette domain-containing protein [Acuticoccus mangrovi]
MLRVENLSVSIAGAEILRDVSLQVEPNAFVGLVGRNGAGKTTLMRAVMNLIGSDAGTIRIAGEDTTRAAPHIHARQGVGYMPEDRRLVPDWSVDDNVRLPAWAANTDDAEARVRRIYELIPEVAKVSDRRAMQLSGGQQKLVALARAFVAGTRLMILDEPFEGVAPALVQRLVEILSTLRSEGDHAVMISESDAVYSTALVDRTFVIERGRVSAV